MFLIESGHAYQEGTENFDTWTESVGDFDFGTGSAVEVLAVLGHTYWKRMGNLDS